MSESEICWNFVKVDGSGYVEGDSPAFEIFNQQVDMGHLQVLVRESIQNSLDAKSETADGVQVTISVSELAGSELENFLKLARVSGEDRGTLMPHLTSGAQGSRKEQLTRGLQQLEDGRLRVLTISDHGTEGLWGEEGLEGEAEGNFHPLLRAAMKTHEESGAATGGSFGLGKVTYWMNSGLSTVLFHSIPEKGPNAGESRLIGRTLLPAHKTTIDGEKSLWIHFGGWLGIDEEYEEGRSRSTSIWGTEASELAESLGIGREPGDTGTSICVVAFDPPDYNSGSGMSGLVDDLEQAVKKWYWPAICTGKLKVSIVGAQSDGEEFAVELDQISVDDELVGDFVALWDRIETGDNTDEESEIHHGRMEWKYPQRTSDPKHDEAEAEVEIGLLLSDDPNRGQPELRNRIALMRGATGMVVQYVPDNRIRIPAARLLEDSQSSLIGLVRTGLMMPSPGPSDEQLERFLKACEPPLHDHWSSTQKRVSDNYKTMGRGGINAAGAVQSYYESIGEFIKSVVEEPIPDGTKAPEKLMRLLTFGRSGDPEPDQPRLLLNKGRSEANSDGWKFTGASFGLNSNHDWDDEEHPWAFEVSAAIPEQGGSGSKLERLQITGITVADGEGTLVVPWKEGEMREAVLVIATPGLNRVSFDLEVKLDSSLDSQSRFRRIAAQLNATEAELPDE